MSEASTVPAPAGEEKREDVSSVAEQKQQQGLQEPHAANAATQNGAGGKRDSDVSSNSEHKQQHQLQQQQQHQHQQRSQAVVPQSQPQQGGGQAKSQGQSSQNSEDATAGPGAGPSVTESFEGRNKIKRHVEASPQGRYLRFEEKLGTGQYKVVYRSYDTWGGIEVAWNTVNIKNLPKEEKKRIMNEVKLLQNLEHKNLVQFHGSWVNREREEVLFVTEIMQSGSLMDFIRKVEMIRWRVVKRWARQILRGIQYLHSQDPPIIHRDLKCDNIFINGAAGDIRIGDLGLSTSNTRSQKTMSVLGTPEFMAPELYEEIYNEKVDIYAFGMCMLEMVTKERPYSECVNAAQIYRKVTSQILPSALDRVQNVRAREFIRVCLNPDPDLRPSAAELQKLAFLNDKDEDEDNSLVLLDPPATVGDTPLLETTANTGAVAEDAAAKTGVNGPTKIDPSLPGMAHPAARGTPGLDTIAETFAGGGSGSNQGQAPTLQSQASGGASQNQTGGGSPPLVQPSGPATSAPGQGDASNSGSGEVDSTGEGKADASRRPSAVPTPVAAVSSNEEAGREQVSAGTDAESSEQGIDRKSIDAPASLSVGSKADSSNGVAVIEPEEAQYGAHKIPGNPPFESDDDDDEQENDVSHPDGFLQAMPEDESGNRVPTLPDGRVRRAEDDDDEQRSESPSSQRDASESSQAAPSSAQAPPLSAALASPPLVPPPAGVAPAPPMQAPKPGAAAGAIDGSLPMAHLSRENSGSVSSAVEGNSIATVAGSSTPGTVSPSGMLPPNMSNSQGTTFTVIGSIEQPALAQAAQGGEKPAAGPGTAFSGSDPGLVSPPTATPVDLQRARSFSPVDRAAEVLKVAALPPIAPAPPCPVAVAPSAVMQPQAHFRGPQDVMTAGNGPGQPMGVGGEAERTPFSSNQGDQELPGLLSGTMGLGGKQTEIMVANLQGPEQEIMRLVMHTHVEGRLQEVDFDFNLEHDHPDQVSAEMVQELGLPTSELWHISHAISNLAEKARRRRRRQTFSNSSSSAAQLSQLHDVSAGAKLFDANAGARLPDANMGPNHRWAASEPAAASDVYRGTQGSVPAYGSWSGDAAAPGVLEPADHDGSGGNVAGAEEEWLDDDVDIEEDDEFRKRRLQHDKKKRQAEKVYEARLAALLAARNDRTDEHKRAQERYKKDCDDFDKKVEKLQSEKDRRMEECFNELASLEDGYRQKQRDAKQAKRHNAASGNIAAQLAHMRLVGQPPLEPAPKPQSYVPAGIAPGHGQGSMQGHGSNTLQGHGSNDGTGYGYGDDGPDQQPTTLSQHKSGEDVLRGGMSIWSSNPHHQQDMSAVVASAAQQHQHHPQQGPNPPDDEERRDRLSTL